MAELFMVQVLVPLIVVVCPLRNDEGNIDMVEDFITHYYLKPDPQRLPAMLDIALKADFVVQGNETRLLIGHAFGHMGRGNQKLIRLYESRFADATDGGRASLVEALRICGDDVTRGKLQKWSQDPVYRTQEKILKAAVAFLANPKPRLPRDRPAESPMHLDFLWADFFTTGEYAPVARILDTLDQPGRLREKIDDRLKKDFGRAELLEELSKLKLIQPGSKDKLVDGDLELTLLHDAKGHLRANAIEDAVYLGRERLDLSDDELNRGLVLQGTASWSIQDNLQQHPSLVELIKKHYRERPARSQELIKKWLRIDQPKVILDKESERLQGTWQAVSWQEDGDSDDPKLLAETLKYMRWKFEDDEVTSTKAFTITTDERVEVKGEGTPWISSYKIDASKSPKVMILTSVSPEEGNITKCIYSVEGDVLRICMSKNDQIPTNFSAKDGSDCILLTLKKAAK